MLFYLIMAKDLGWIKLHRSSFNNKLYFSESFTRWQAWADLLLIANHTQGFVRVRGIRHSVLRGQVGFSMVELSKRWRWSKGKVLRYLNELSDEHQIVLQKNNITTLISIVNYNKYQIYDTANDTADSIANSTANSTADGQQTVKQNLITTMNVNELQGAKNEKNEKEENNKYITTGVSPPEILVFYPRYSDYNGLPLNHEENLIRLTKVTKQAEINHEDVTALWEVFKEQNLNGDKPYKSDSDIYRHFINWGNKQSFRKKTIPKTQKSDKKIIGVKFSDDFKECEMSDGSVQKLTPNQMAGAEYNQISPNSISKK